MFDYLMTKKASDLRSGDFVTLTGNKDEIAEIEYADLEDDLVAIRTNDGRGKCVDYNDLIKVYTIEI